MKYILLLSIFLHLHLYGAQKHELITKAYIAWGDNLHVELSTDGFKTSKGVNVFASFALKGDKFRSVELNRKNINYPLYEMVLARKDYTIYILDLKEQKMIGKFNVPSKGTPRFIKIEPNDKQITNLKYHFRISPKKGTKGRPGPLIEKILRYKDGKYRLIKKRYNKKRNEINSHDYYKRQIVNHAKRSEGKLKERFYKLIYALKENPQVGDDEHDKSILEALRQNQEDWFDYRYSYCQSRALMEVYPSKSRLYTESISSCLTQLNKDRTVYINSLILEIKK